MYSNFTCWPISEFAQSIGARNLAMLVAYFDESGTHGNKSKAVCISGFVGTSTEWARLEKPWSEHLLTLGVSTFHASECEAGTGEFFGKHRGLRESLANGLTIEIAKRNIALITTAVLVDDWNKCASHELKERFKTPYHFCFEFVMHKIDKWSRANVGGEPVALVFADQEQFKERAKIIHDLYFDSKQNFRLGSLTFAKPQCVIPLQAADLSSYEAYQWLLLKNSVRDDPINLLERRPLLKQLLLCLNDPGDAGFHDCSTLPLLKPMGMIERRD